MGKAPGSGSNERFGKPQPTRIDRKTRSDRENQGSQSKYGKS